LSTSTSFLTTSRLFQAERLLVALPLLAWVKKYERGNLLVGLLVNCNDNGHSYCSPGVQTRGIEGGYSIVRCQCHAADKKHVVLVPPRRVCVCIREKDSILLRIDVILPHKVFLCMPTTK
jgi:hypothetical protein